jgi:ATP-dependent Clp protease ATP-binding subunit ClpC
MDMSEFSEGYTVSKLLGAPAGYIGHNDSVRLTDHIRKRPYSVVLFDEIEKAHPDIFNVLLQILDEGRVIDSNGRELNFRNTIVILTSNVGLQAFTRQAAGLGFQHEATLPAHEKEHMEEIIHEELQDVFPREFLNRLDHQIIFNPLTQASMRQIVQLEIAALKKRLAAKRLSLTIAPAVKQRVIEQSFSPENGARRVRQAMAQLIEEPIADALIVHAEKARSKTLKHVTVGVAKNGNIQVKVT